MAMITVRATRHNGAPTRLSRLVPALCYLLLASVAVAAADTTPDGNPDHFDNLRWTVDLSARGSYMTDTDEWSGQYVLGLDLHKVFTGPSGDIGTLVFQPYLVRLDNNSYPPYFFDDGDDWELVWRIANFNYTALARGRFNIRVGHFEVPFGLEQNIDTNGTLRQYTFRDRGIKADWGASVNGVLTSTEYEIAVSRGSGNDIRSTGDPYILSGRVGSRSDRNLIAGLSFLHGEILGSAGTTERTRVGLDVAWYRGLLEMLFEISAGEDDGTDTFNGLAELSLRNPMETLHGWLQLRHYQADTTSGWDIANSATLGLAWEPDRNWSLSSQWIEPVDQLTGRDEGSKFQLQIRYRF
jgi:hypothetical protein